jgi:hypothetical protein
LQPGVALRQFRGAAQAHKVPVQGALAIAMSLRQRRWAQLTLEVFAALFGGLMRQQGNGFRCHGLGVGIEFDALRTHLELRFVDDLAVYSDPAALDEQLRLAARTAEQFDQAFGKANGFRHDSDRSGIRAPL